jgi:hypothetical protein
MHGCFGTDLDDLYYACEISIDFLMKDGMGWDVWPCLVYPEIQKVFKISHHIKLGENKN